MRPLPTRVFTGLPFALRTGFPAGLLVGLLGLAAAGSAEAQFAQYTTPGGPAGRPADKKAEIAQDFEDARLHFGALHVAPWLAVKDVSLVQNLVGAALTEKTDLTVTVGAGARAYLRTSPKVMWIAYALPEYVWWQRQAERRRVNGRLGGEVYGFFNRLKVHADAGRDESQAIVTPEVLRLANNRRGHGSVSLEANLSGKVSLFASGQISRNQTLLDRQRDPQSALLAQLDHEDRVVRGGLRWRPQTGWLIGVGAERSDARFLNTGVNGLDRGNHGTAPILEVTREQSRLFFSADVAFRSLTATSGSTFVDYRKVTGHGSLGWRFNDRAELFVYGDRNLVYSLLPDYSYLDDRRLGLSYHLKLGRRAGGSLYIEGGPEDYTRLTATAAPRRDTVTAYGGVLQVGLGRYTSLKLQGGRTHYRSSLPGNDRTFAFLGASFGLNIGKS